MSNKKMARKIDEGLKITTIKLGEETKLRLGKLRENKRESYDEILRKILYILNVARDDPEKARKVLERVSELRARMLDEERQQKEDLEKENGLNKID